MDFEFEWDDVKAESNLRKHGVSFNEAASAVADGRARVKPDPDHSMFEDRARVLGFSDKNRLLLSVVRARGSAIRIISARKATRSESRWYAKDQD